jgi:hypothetical protein
MGSKVDYIFPFGRHKGKLVSEIYETDAKYLHWAIDNCLDIPTGLSDAIKYHLDE